MKRAKRKRRIGGSTLVEFALVLPLLLILIVNAINFGGFFFAWITVANAARAGADYMAMGLSSVGQPQPPSVDKITEVVNADIASLPNRGTVVIRVCKRSPSGSATVLDWDDIDGTTLCPAASPAFSPPPADTRPEATQCPLCYVTGWVDVRYDYKPLIDVGFKFPLLNLYTAILPRTIHRQAVMRLDQ